VCDCAYRGVSKSKRGREREIEKERKSEMKKERIRCGVFKVNSFFSEDALEII
jgi:hypothetical protein